MPVMQHYASVEDYFQSQPQPVREGLEQIRKAIRQVVPDAEEVISYCMPAFKQEGILIWYAATKKHYGFYPKSNVIHVFGEQLKPYDLSKGTIRFPIGKPLPLQLIKDIVRFRVKENKELAEAKKVVAKKTVVMKKR